MKIKWLGHASFLITSENGVKIITDPYAAGMMGLNYGEIKESADIVTASHEHGDHNNVAAIQRNPEVVNVTGTVAAKGITFKGIATHHDDAGGSARGNNIIFCFTVDGIRPFYPSKKRVYGSLRTGGKIEIGFLVAFIISDIGLFLVRVF